MRGKSYKTRLHVSLNEKEADIMQMDMNYQLMKVDNARKRVKQQYKTREINRGEYLKRMRFYDESERLYRDLCDIIHQFISKRQGNED